MFSIHIELLLFFGLQYCGHTALTFACMRGNFASISVLLKLGANPNVCTQVCNMDNMCAIHKLGMKLMLRFVCEDAQIYIYSATTIEYFRIV